MDIKENEISFSNLDKIYFPKAKITKGDVVRYYSAISKFILPYLESRPLTLKRYPEGIQKAPIYQRHLTNPKDKRHLDSVRAFVEEESEYKQFILCPDTEGLLYLTQLGTIEIHPWNSKVGSLKKPNFLVFDLDPPKNDFKKAVAAALDLKVVLSRLKLNSFVKTSGKGGIHVFVPIKAIYSFEKVRSFARTIGEELIKRKSNITLEIRKKNRGSAVFFDVNQNGYSRSMVSIYSLRATPEATVSFPVEWARLSKIRPSDFTIRTVPTLLKKGDPWKQLLGRKGNSIIL